jgi:PAS domain S-box-containing protein
VLFALAGTLGALALSGLTLFAREQWVTAGIVGVVALVIVVIGAIVHGLVRRLEEGELWLHTIITGAPDAIITVGSDGRIRRSNPAAAAMFGYREGALAGRSFATLFPAASGIDEGVEDAGFAAVLHQIGLHAGNTVTVAGLRREGGRFHMELAVSFLELAGDAFYTVIARDVSDRIRTQEALHEAHATLEARVEERTAELRAQMEARARIEAHREKLVGELRVAVSQIRTLRGLLPICASCKRVRDDTGYWQQIESFVRDHSEAEFSHGICPECRDTLYPELRKTTVDEPEPC